MNKKIIKAVSIDWEGCCSEPGGGRMPWPTQKIAQLASILRLLWQVKNVRFFLNTGRQAPYVEAALQALGIVTNAPSIFENGSGLYYPATKNFEINPVITESMAIEFDKIRTELKKFTEKIGSTRELGKEYCFSSNPPSGMSIEDYFELIKNQFKNDIGKIIEVTHSQSAVDVTINGVNKKSGLAFWCHKEGIDVEELGGIGDSRGDWPALEKVALPMCPSNATEETKLLVEKRNGYISPYPTTLGTIDCIAFLSRHPFIRNVSKKIIYHWHMNYPIELTRIFTAQ